MLERMISHTNYNNELTLPLSQNGTRSQTKNGHVFDLTDLAGTIVFDPEEIFHSLSMQCRFNGHCDRFYSVGEHTNSLVNYAKNHGLSKEIQLQLLLHDVGESFLGDMITPLKAQFSLFKNYEDKILRIILIKHNLPPYLPSLIKYLDTRILLLEKKVLCPKFPRWTIEDTVEPLDWYVNKTEVYSPKEIKNSLLSSYESLIKNETH